MSTDTLTKSRWVYSFGGGSADGDASMKNLLGGKGANLAEMSSLGLPVPPGFTITTEACVHYYSNEKQYPAELKDQVVTGLATVEKITGKTFGDTANPLLVSVRSGARASMPGMMDTVLNLGLNDETVEGLAKLSGDRRFAFDSYRRFIQMYSAVVLDLDHHMFEEILDEHKERLDVTVDTGLTAEDWEKVVADYKAAVQQELGQPFPQDPHAQLWGAVGAVFASWMNDRAKFYRRMHDIPESWGTAVNVQSMVFGNMGDSSATGVAFTRNPSTGEARLYGEFLINAQGEDVVAGIRTPQALTKIAREEMGEKALSMEEALPEVFLQFKAVVEKLEKHYRDMQDIEFTVEQGRLYMLQTRNGKRTAKAALKIAVDLASEGLITQEEAIMRVEPASLDQLLHPTIDPASPRDVITTGLPASPGAATGKIVFNSDEAERLGSAGEAVILVRDETSPEDIHGMHAARGIVTARGGMTSHAAVVARGMGRPCVSGAGELQIDGKASELRVRSRVFKAGDILTIDGSRGEILAGAVQMIEPELTGDFATLMVWADKVRRLKVRANAETPLDARTARQFGAEGIGLCRTEHMFFDEDRIAAVREMILADDEAGRRNALAKILPMQRNDFVELFTIMEGLPVTIRLLDPPLHEFLPHTEADLQAVADATGIDATKLMRRAKELHETNPMLGHRGCRLAVSYPEIYEMQVRAIFEAACEIAESGKAAPIPEIMHPLVAKGEEMRYLRQLTDKTAQAVLKERGREIEYQVGTMIELPRAAIRAGDLAENAEFFSFGTNDLTQTTFGISRDDSGRFLGAYLEKGIFEKDPFVSLDQEGVGDLIRLAAERGRAARPNVKLGICGEHGGDPASIEFCESVGLDYVSCSPFRVPIARLAAAQAAVGGMEKDR
ncbi:pyruvate phosphate dikinase [Phenylobacterium sp. Root77]|uniref:pyruvate, phosphate dikinase n=1 Tax=unclassified Phenylobacterium TaxID=2640670 RepID=UPI0006FFA822|nr:MULTISPECIES: pyruvate, phosphate dikinase [unclassified Phenylobacterium]KQW71932.1 pyruvate phosphate dikinase [Phenylobacterium sp. Root1277]KQW94853.1 pyruvate phosphate dikinase [Phenylobacterium sp. Root1290]KRC44547.1 pyruvate phosphate dikinase [Phenylobacterium sp. Root77]